MVFFLDGLHAIAVVQGITKTEVFPSFQQEEVGNDLSLQLSLDALQGLLFLGLGLPLGPGLGQV